MCFSMSSPPTGHVGDASSTSDIKVGKKKTTVKFPCMLCEGDHYSHLFPCMSEASYILEKFQLPIGYRKIPPNPSIVDEMVNPVPSLVSLVDQVVNLVSSSVETLTKVADLVPSSISPTFHLKGETQVIDPYPSSVSPTFNPKSAKVVDPVPPSVDPTPPLRSAKVVTPVISSVDPTPPLRSAKVVAPVTSSVNPTLPLKSAKVVDPVPPSIDPTPPFKSATKVVYSIPSSIDPTLPLESKPNTAHVFLVDTKSIMLGGIPPSLVKHPPSDEAILFYWGALTGPCIPSHIPFKIIVHVYGWVIPKTLIDEGASVSILSSVS
jgi:hypothetical protein